MMETLWTCDKCKVLSFASFEEADEHEKGCNGVSNDESDDEVQIISPPSRGAGKEDTSIPTPPAKTAGAKSGAMEEMWTCDKCNVALFKSYNEAVSHEKNCTGDPNNGTAGKAAQAAQVSPHTTDDISVENSFICDLCKVAEFKTFKEAEEHEAKCSAGTRKRDAAPQKSSRAPSQHEKKRCDRVSDAAPPKTTIWTCDVCKSAEFPTFDEAAEHEKTCVGNAKTKSKAASGSDTAVPPRLESRADKGYDISSRKKQKSAQKRKAADMHVPARTFPLISDITSNENVRLSPFNLLAMTQIDLVPKQGMLSARGEESVVKYEPRCRHCGLTSKVNTLGTLHKGIYSMTYSHLLKSCPHIPATVRESLQSHQRNKKASNASLGLRQFCNVLIDKLRLDQSAGSAASRKIQHELIGTLSKERNNHQHRKRAPESAVSSRNVKKSKRPKSESKTAHVFTFEDEDGVETILPPVGGVPLSSSFVSSEITKLSDYEQHILSHLELVEDLGRGRSRRPLVVRCRSCKFHPSLCFAKPLQSIKRWHEVVEEMGHHIVSCNFLSRPNREIILRSRTNGAQASGSLKSFCSYLAGFFAMQESRALGDSGGVFWGECQPLKPGYLFPVSKGTSSTSPLLASTRSH